MEEFDLLDAVLGKTADVVDAVDVSTWGDPTPCSDYTVKDLLAHMVGWSASFAATAEGHTSDADPSAYQASEASAAEFRRAVERIVAGWRNNGLDRQLSLVGAGELPGRMVFEMTLMEYLAHGWDLAKATGQEMPYTAEEAQAVLDLAQKNLPAQYRGEDKPFGEIVDVPVDAPPLDRFAGFMGRMP